MKRGILMGGQVVELPVGEIPLFPLDHPAAAAVFGQMVEIIRRVTGKEAARVLISSSWRPEYEGNPATWEWIGVHPNYLTDDLQAALDGAGLAASILVQKTEPWLRDHYATLDEAGQVAFDRAWVEAGGWLSPEKLERLERVTGRV